MAVSRSTAEPTASQIRDQRNRITSSKVFALSKRQIALLENIVEAALEGRADKLKEFTLAIEVFGRDKDFDPRIDSIVRVEASRLRAKLIEYYSLEGRDDPVKIDIPKGHYVPVFQLIDRDSSVDKLEEEKDHDRPDTITPVSRRNLNLTLIGIMAVAIVYLIVDNYVLEQAPLSSQREVSDKSIAVLPFLPLSSGEDDGYFADGLTEEILNSLAQLPELRVTARTSSFFFKGQNLLVPEIASRLGVANVVEGSVRRDGNRLRISAQLIRAADDFHLWSQTYDRTREDVFAVQEDIAENIATVLGVVLDDASRAVMRDAGIRDVDAFIAYQKGQEEWVTAHKGMTRASDLQNANALFESALEAAPGLIMARLRKADLRSHVVFEIVSGFRDATYEGELQETLAALREEYDLAVESSSAANQRDILALERTLFGEDWRGLPFQIQKAMQPEGCPQMNWTPLIAHFGWADQLVTKFHDAIRCNPMDTYANFQLVYSLIWSGDFDAALSAIADADNKGLSHPSLNDARYWALLASGRVDDRDAPGPGTQETRLTHDRQILHEALTGDPKVAREMAKDYWSGPNSDDLSSMMIAAVIGDRKRANEMAARIDAYPGSAIVISHGVFNCFCGAPFDLEATPNYKARIEEAGFPWPPPKPIDYPAKTW